MAIIFLVLFSDLKFPNGPDLAYFIELLRSRSVGLARRNVYVIKSVYAMTFAISILG